MVKNKYLQFEDDETIFWSILFEEVDWNLFKNELNKHCIIDEVKEVPLNEAKTNILERMANLGHFTPVPKFIPSDDSSDSEIKTKEKPIIHPRKLHHTKNKTPEMTLVPYNSNQEIVPATNLFVESSLNSLDSKVDKILDQMKVLGLGANNDREDEILLLETKVLDLKKENRQLRVLIREIQANEDGQKIIKELRDSVLMFQQKFAGQENFILNLNEKLVESSKISEENQWENNQIIEKLNSKLILNENLVSDLRKQLDETNTVNSTKISDMEKLLKEKPEIPDIEGKIKEMMNTMYSSLCDHFSEKEQFSQNEILRVLGTTIKNETKLVLSELKKL